MCRIFKRPHMDGSGWQSFQATGRNSDDALGIRVDHISGANGNPSNFHRLSALLDPKRTVMNRGASAVCRKRNAKETAYIPDPTVSDNAQTSGGK